MATESLLLEADNATKPQVTEASAVSAMPIERPWERPWWKPMEGKYAIAFYLLTIHVLALIGLIMFPVPGWKLFAVTLAFTCMGGMGTTVCYHRTLSHRSLKLNKAVEHF